MATEKKAPKAAKAKAVKAKAPAADTVSTGQSGELGVRRFVVGTVVSDKMTKTVVVKVDRQVRHKLYKKYLNKSHRVKAHDETNSAKVGDLVELVETRPLSADKRWALRRVIRRAAQTIDVAV